MLFMYLYNKSLHSVYLACLKLTLRLQKTKNASLTFLGEQKKGRTPKISRQIW